MSQQSQVKVKVCIRITSIPLASLFPPRAKHVLGCGPNTLLKMSFEGAKRKGRDNIIVTKPQAGNRLIDIKDLANQTVRWSIKHLHTSTLNQILHTQQAHLLLKVQFGIWRGGSSIIY